MIPVSDWLQHVFGGVSLDYFFILVKIYLDYYLITYFEYLPQKYLDHGCEIILKSILSEIFDKNITQVIP